MIDLDQAIDLEEEAREQAAREALLAQEDRLGPMCHREAFYDLLYASDREAEADAWLFGIRPRTMRNRLRLARNRVARRNFHWGPLPTLEALEAECDRLLELASDARELYELSQRPVRTERTVISRQGERKTSRIRSRRGDVRLLRFYSRAKGDLHEIMLRIKQLKWSQASDQPEAPARDSARGSDEAAAREDDARPLDPWLARRASVRRTKRRKSLSGRRLRLPQIVGARPVSMRFALVASVIFISRRGPVRCRGDPVPCSAAIYEGFE